MSLFEAVVGVSRRPYSFFLDAAGREHQQQRDGGLAVFLNDILKLKHGSCSDGSRLVGAIQVNGHLGYSIVKHPRHEFVSQIGIVLRYQSSSVPDAVTTYYPAISVLPVPVVVFENTSPQRTFAPGGAVQLRYHYVINQKILIGIKAGFQVDTQGDVLHQFSLGGGYEF